MKDLNEPKILVNLKDEMASFILHVCQRQSIQDLSPAILWAQRIIYPFFGL